jgi:hypothetical protein
MTGDHDRPEFDEFTTPAAGDRIFSPLSAAQCGRSRWLR